MKTKTATASKSDRTAAALKAAETRRQNGTQAAAAKKAAATRRYAEMVARQDGINEALEAVALGLN